MELPEPIPDKWLKKLHGTRRLTLASKCYYESRLNKYKRWDKSLKIVLALTSFTVVGLAIWRLLFSQDVVTYIQATAAAISVFIGLLQPFLGLTEKIDKSKELLGTYEHGVDQFDELAFLIEKDKTLTVEEFKKLYAAHKRAIGNTSPNDVELTECYNRVVNKKLSPDFWRIAYIAPKDFLLREEDDKQ